MGKRVLVIGATGTMGNYLVPELVELGYSVTGVSLDAPKNPVPGVAYHTGDCFDMGVLTPLLAQKFDGIVNFMDFDTVHPFREYYRSFLDNTGHYIYLSSCRVYADEEVPVRETSPRLLEVSKDERFLASNNYSLRKAKDEDLLWSTDYNNFTIVRPATIFSKMSFQLVTLANKNTMGRALKGKKVVLPIQAKDKPATLCWGGDVAKMIARLMFKEETFREAYNVCSSESHTWGEIADYYKQICGLEAVWVDKEDYLRIINPIPGAIGARYQLEYARMARRITDNSKMLAVTGLKQEEFMPLYDGLKMMYDAIPEGYVFAETDVGARMDEYLKEHAL